jgi:hypothetical protein
MLGGMPSWTLRTGSTPSTGDRVVTVGLVGGLLAYAALALVEQRWVSGLAAPIVAALLWGRHRRARFSAYVFFSALALRGFVTGSWALVVFAGASVLVLQMPAARRAWPRLVAGGRSSTRGTPSST